MGQGPDPDLSLPAGRLHDAQLPHPEGGHLLPLRTAANRRLFEQARDIGGYFYPVGSVPMSPDDWRQHFGSRWHQLFAAKWAFDPDALLAPGQGVFVPE